VHPEQQALVLGERAVKGEGEPVDLAPQPPLGEVGHGGRGGAALSQGALHQHAGHAKHVAHHAHKLDAGTFEQLERAVAFRGHGADQGFAMAHQLAQHPDRRQWHEARAHQPTADQVGDPLGVLHVRLASGHVTHVRGIADDDGEVTFQGSMHRLPVNTRALHADVGDTQGFRIKRRAYG